MNLSTPIKRLRLVAVLEGISYLLFAVTVPLKYLYHVEAPNFIIGMAHGVLFVLYVLLCLQNIYLHKWDWKTSLIALGASLLPVATFVVDAKLFKSVEQESAE